MNHLAYQAVRLPRLEYKDLVPGVRIPAIGLGTWGMGGKHAAEYSSDAQSVDAIRTAIDLGITHIDTAEYYGAGHTEELVGEAIEPFERKNLFITTKVYRTHLRYKAIMTSIKKSLKRFRVDYVDLFLVHWPNPKIEIAETAKALEQCVDEGYTRFIGVSNFSVKQFCDAQQHLKKHKFVANQLYYNLTRVGKTYFYGLSVEDAHSYCRENDILLIAWSPLEQGSLAKPGFPVLDEIANQYGKTQSQVALNWLISQEKIIAIPKASTVDHIEEFVGAMGWRLSDEDVNRLEASFRNATG